MKWKVYDNSFNRWINKKRPGIKMSQYFPKSFRSFGGNINVEVDLSSYATKTDLKNVTHVDTYSFALKANLSLTAVESNIRNVSSLVKKSKL